MAESLVLEAWNTSSIPCRYFANGVCRKGDRCLYLHDESLSQIVSGGDQSKNMADPHDIETDSTITDSLPEDEAGSSMHETEPSRSGNTSTTSSNTALKDTSDRNMSSSNGSAVRSNEPNLEPVICSYFQKGCCRFGDNCRNKHERDENLNSSRTIRLVDMTENCSSIISNKASTSDSDAPTYIAQEALSEVTDMSSISSQESSTKGPEMKTKLRVNAPEFIPCKPTCSIYSESLTEESNESTEGSAVKTWAQVVNANAGNGVPSPFMSLCPYAEAGECPYAEKCTYIHGHICEFCGNACLHPTNEEQRKSHTDECIKQHERDMELAFAVARSKDKQCGVCFEVVVDKNPASEQRFGILPNCNHCFCLACIRKWRQAKQFENKIIRACPECRVTSDFVCPSMYWVDTKEEKDKLINAYKDALSNKQCKYFKQGRGKCPFGNKCFYLHAYPDGTKVDTGPPIRRHRQNADGETDVLQLLLWDFLDERDNRWLYSLEDLDLMGLLSGSEDSDISDIEF